MRALPSTVAAPAAWRTVDLVSDLHLHLADGATFAAFRRYLRDTPADAIFLLGDIFEVWIGDDAAAPGSFESDCAQRLRQAAASRALFFLHGNRDFLLGQAWLRESGVTLLHDPCLLDWHDRRWLLSHGDALCLGDTDYQRFRAEVRTPAWQQAFLARPLEERRRIADGLRQASEAHKAGGADYADADPELADAWLSRARADTLVHGHTHRPAEHRTPAGKRRLVLSDWDLLATPPRAEALRIGADGSASRISLV